MRSEDRERSWDGKDTCVECEAALSTGDGWLQVVVVVLASAAGCGGSGSVVLAWMVYRVVQDGCMMLYGCMWSSQLAERER